MMMQVRLISIMYDCACQHVLYGMVPIKALTCISKSFVFYAYYVWYTSIDRTLSPFHPRLLLSNITRTSFAST
jgi:hypothetical protein